MSNQSIHPVISLNPKFKPASPKEPLSFEEFLLLRDEVLPLIHVPPYGGICLYYLSTNNPVHTDKEERCFLLWTPSLDKDVPYKIQNVIAVALNLVTEESTFPVYIISNLTNKCADPKTFTLAYNMEQVDATSLQRTQSYKLWRKGREQNAETLYPKPPVFTPPQFIVDEHIENKNSYYKSLQILSKREEEKIVCEDNSLQNQSSSPSSPTVKKKLTPAESLEIYNEYKYTYDYSNYSPHTPKKIREKLATKLSYEFNHDAVCIFLDGLLPKKQDASQKNYDITYENFNVKNPNTQKYERIASLCTLTVTFPVLRKPDEEGKSLKDTKTVVFKGFSSLQPTPKENALCIAFRRFQKKYLRQYLKKSYCYR